MTIRLNKLTPERLLGNPRRSSAQPSPDGKFALYTCTTYSFETHSKSAEICVLDIATGLVTVLSTDVKASEPKWVGDGHEVAWLKDCDNGNTSLIVADASAVGKSYTAGTIAGPVSNLKLYFVKTGMVAVAVAGQANPDGSLYNPKNSDSPKKQSTAKVYDSLFVRHWDRYVTPQKNAIFTALLQKSPSRVTNGSDKYDLLGLTNALKDSGLECPIPPFGGTDHFDIGRLGLIIVAKDPDLSPATHTKCNAYFIPREDLMDMSTQKPVKIKLDGFEGAASSPVFSPNGHTVAFLQMKQDGYESDQNRIILLQDVKDPTTACDILGTVASGTVWDRSPSSILWSNSGDSLYILAEDTGVGALFELKLQSNSSGPNPRTLLMQGHVNDAAPLSKDSSKLFISSNSLVNSSVYQILDPSPASSTEIAPSSSSSDVSPQPSQEQKVAIQTVSLSDENGERFGLSPSQVKSLWWQGDKHQVHGWMILPSHFRPTNKYPLAYLIHGGPQGAWNDQWSTRWNPALFAEQGYIVISPNPTGSTGYGQSFTDAIKSNWGGSPYIDIENGFNYIKSHLPYVDTTRAVALGASYGGYMMNWIQGHSLGPQFKALVCHDGVFSMTSQLASDEQYFPVHDMGGPLWDRQEIYDKFDPARFAKNWSTPMLVIHNELDYRLTMAEGLAAFNCLQMRGIQSRFLSFPDENHWVLKHENSLVWHLVVLNWINSFVGLGKVVDREGRDGSEYLQSERGRLRRR